MNSSPGSLSFRSLPCTFRRPTCSINLSFTDMTTNQVDTRRKNRDVHNYFKTKQVETFYGNERHHDIETLITTSLNLVPLVFAFLSIKRQTAIKISSRSFISLFSHYQLLVHDQNTSEPSIATQHVIISLLNIAQWKFLDHAINSM